MARCKAEKVSIKKTHGRKLKTPITFTRHVGEGCKKPSRKTGHLKPWKEAFAIAQPQCGKRHGFFNKKFGACMRGALKSVDIGRGKPRSR